VHLTEGFDFRLERVDLYVRAIGGEIHLLSHTKRRTGNEDKGETRAVWRQSIKARRCALLTAINPIVR